MFDGSFVKTVYATLLTVNVQPPFAEKRKKNEKNRTRVRFPQIKSKLLFEKFKDENIYRRQLDT